MTNAAPQPLCCALVLFARWDQVALVERALENLSPAQAARWAEITLLIEGERVPERVPRFANEHWVSNPRRYDWGGRRKVALDLALERGFDAVLLVEASDGVPLSALEALVAAAEMGGHDVVIGARRGSWLGLWLHRIVLGPLVCDWASGVRLYRTRFLARVPFHANFDDRRFDSQILIQARALGVRPHEISLAHERSGFSALQSLGVAIDYRLHQLHVRRLGEYLVDRGVHYTLKHSPSSSHAQILAAIPAGARVLDLGCSQGLLAWPLREKGTRVTGVDLAPPAAISADLERYYQRDLESALELPEGRVFDRVIVSDVIEHVQNRAQLLRSVRRHLVPEGRLLISTPNIAIWFYRLSLAVGRFEYGPRGVLDETHVHLFTLSTFRREVERGGFRIVQERVTALPFEIVFESTGQSHVVGWLSSCYHLLARMWPRMFAYQFLLEAEVRDLTDFPSPPPPAPL